ncbi:MAG: hypothetical protein KatS3mg029_0545 [Saprospiraceae bacterium]|nr:MAG: hypothetical protein KatS3mg029_0537 [Saprospiraceae bacterium]GIV31194.1 MAG: hypothetical protein KatS3mg029_0545 [Saprospiraceae bacterium]
MLGLRLDLPVRRPDGKVELLAQRTCLPPGRNAVLQGATGASEQDVRARGRKGPCLSADLSVDRQAGSASERPRRRPTPAKLPAGWCRQASSKRPACPADRRAGRCPAGGEGPPACRQTCLSTDRQGALAEPESTRPRAELPAELANADRRRGGRPNNFSTRCNYAGSI